MSLRAERILLGIFLLIFACFTWRGLMMFYSGDDMMNMYTAWSVNPWRLARAQLMLWLPVYRPLGGAIYRIFYAIFGFHPAPLYVFCWAILVANVVVAYRLFRAISATAAEALIALSLTLVHGNFQDLYLSAGTIYDRLWFLFTALGITVYARARRQHTGIPVPTVLLLCLLSILSMDSKESGIALPALLACYECVFILPSVLQRKSLASWLRSQAPLYGVLAALSLIFVFLRVNRTPVLTQTAAYHPHASVAVWLARVAGYFSLLTYSHLSFSTAVTAGLVIASALIAVLLRNRPMIFGWLLFVITITPVALITSRPGYVLYVPCLGLGLYIAAAIAGLARFAPRGEFAALAVIAIAMTWVHARNWPASYDPQSSPERHLTEQFRREYPKLAAGSNLLFVTDEFPKSAFDLLFNLQLLYKDRSISVQRLEAPSDQQPDPKHPVDYAHVFTLESGRYAELDTGNVAESIRLHILRDYTVGRAMDMARRDHGAYIVSGVMDGDVDSSGRWTGPQAKLKFDLYPAPAIFSTKFWVPDFVAKPIVRTLSILVDGKQIGSVALTQDGMNEISFPVAANLIAASGYTIVEMNVDKPYTDPTGAEFGVVLLKAGFQYSPKSLY